MVCGWFCRSVHLRKSSLCFPIHWWAQEFSYFSHLNAGMAAGNHHPWLGKNVTKRCHLSEKKKGGVQIWTQITPEMSINKLTILKKKKKNGQRLWGCRNSGSFLDLLCVLKHISLPPGSPLSLSTKWKWFLLLNFVSTSWSNIGEFLSPRLARSRDSIHDP